jgi:hypothetical protein
MPNGANDVVLLAILFAVLVGLLAIATLLGALLLRAAVALYNRLAGGISDGVPTPSFWVAIQIMFAAYLAQLAAGFFIEQIADSGRVVVVGGNKVHTRLQLIPVFVNLIILTIMLWLLLPTTFARAIMVTLCYMLVVALVVGVIILIVINLSGDVLRGL